MKKARKTGACLHEKASKFGASKEWKNSEPTSDGASKTQSQKRRVVKMRLKKPAKDSGEWESRIHATGSDLSFCSCERGQVLTWAVGERDMISWSS